MRKLFTSESVTEGHPDKICDQVSDAVLDALLAADPLARVACEVTVCPGLVQMMGEITTTAKVDYETIARRTIAAIGYTDEAFGFSASTCQVQLHLNTQSPDIALGTNETAGGAGDQGMMFGYACDETPEYMPLPIALAHRLARRLAMVRKNGYLCYLRPDGKTQVTVEYEDDRPIRVDTVVVSAQHAPQVSPEQLRQDILRYVIHAEIPPTLLDENTRIFINPTGRFVVGGPAGDSGLTGRKIIVDTYGGWARHGGGAFSGKDPTKVDRSAAYAARHIAKNVVAAGLARRCEVQLAYAIGVTEPVSLLVDTFDTGSLPDARLAQVVRTAFNLTPTGIIHALGLRRPIYRAVAAYGHMGRTDLDLPWERLDKTDMLHAALSRGWH